MTRGPVLAALLAALLAAPSSGSDFSELGEPTFARTMLLTPARQHETQCVGAALASAHQGSGKIATADAAAMAEALAARIATEIGDADRARDYVAGRGRSWLPHELDSNEYVALKREGLEMALGQCAPYYARYAEGGVAGFLAGIEPAGGLIALLSIEECLAVVDLSARLEHSPYQKEDGHDIAQRLEQSLSPSARTARRVAVAAARTRLAQMDDDQLELRSIACLATFRAAYSATAPER